MSSKLTFDVLHNRDFRSLLFSRMFSLSALQAQAVIIGWQIYTLTRDPLMLGLIGLAEALPAIACALFAGYIVDRSRPQRVFAWAIGGLTIDTFVLFCIGSGLFAFASHHFLILAYISIFISGFVRSFIMPSSFSLLAQIVEKKDIPAASAWLSSGFQLAAIVAPAIAGILYGAYGPLVAWLMPMCLMASAFFFACLIRTAPERRAVQLRESAIKSIKEGWSFILRTPVLLGAMAVDMLAVLFGGAIALLPAFATEILEIGSEGLGALRAAPAAGAVIMALILAVKPMKEVRIRTLLWVVAGFGVSIIGFGLSTSFALSLIFLALSGVFDSVSMVVRQTLMQFLTPDTMRGRVSSVNSMFIISSNEIGAFESGALARLIGLVPAVVLGGVGTLAVAGWVAITSPTMRNTIIKADDIPLKS